ncbi:MAG: hypothetical protein MUC88_03255 [Planctomycetes bacterium]|nr:hypothetical protein [Planctomycetota bacterium]
MLKKSLLVMAIAVLSTGAYARDYVTPDGSTVDWEFDGNSAERKAEAWNWPATYDFQDVCVIPVKMDVGFWIKVVDAKKKELKLKQVEIHKYAGSVDVQIITNVNLKLEAKWSKASGMPTMNQDSLSVTPSTLDAPGGTVTIALKLKDVDLSQLQGGQNCLQVGTVTLRVRPAVTPQLASGCG